jgi:hypothetical protein
MAQPATDTITVTGPMCTRLLITGPGHIEPLEERLPPPAKHDVYARTVVFGIGHGRTWRGCAARRPRYAAPGTAHAASTATVPAGTTQPRRLRADCPGHRSRLGRHQGEAWRPGSSHPRVPARLS